MLTGVLSGVLAGLKADLATGGLTMVRPQASCTVALLAVVSKATASPRTSRAPRWAATCSSAWQRLSGSPSAEPGETIAAARSKP